MQKGCRACVLHIVYVMGASHSNTWIEMIAFRLSNAEGASVGARQGEAGWRVSTVHCAQDG